MQVLLGAGVGEGGGTSQSLASQQYLGKWYWDKQLSLGGKTGTSNSHADAWFVGVTPNLVGGAWVGGEYRQIHFRTGALGQGSKTALPIFGIFMNKVLSNPELSKKYLATYTEPVGIDPNIMSEQQEYIPVDSTLHDTLNVEAMPELDELQEASEKQEKEAASESSELPVKHDDDDLFN